MLRVVLYNNFKKLLTSKFVYDNICTDEKHESKLKGWQKIMDFFNAVKNTETTASENGAVMFKSSGNALVDLNFKVPKMRDNAIHGKTDENYHWFLDAYNENPEYALRWLLFSRDIRGGLGERDIFRYLLVDICKNNIELGMKLFSLPLEEFGRFDDIIEIYDKVNSAIQGMIIDFIYQQLHEDIACMKEGKAISLLAKWMPSINTSSDRRRYLANLLAKELHLSPRQYRKMLARLRKYLNVVEINISKKQYENIDYSTVPSKANILYRNAFFRHDEERRTQYLESLSKGETKINAEASFLYDIVGAYMEDSEWSTKVRPYDETLEAMWKSQKPIDMVADTLVVRDGSGSMTTPLPKSHTTALDVATAITLYCAEHNTHAYKDKFITFSNRPQMITLHGKTLHDKLEETCQYDDCSSTNLQSTFELILDTAIKNKLSQKDLPKNVLIVSDMEFNPYAIQTDRSVRFGIRDYENFDSYVNTLMMNISKEFKEAGYKMPRLIFWNVNSRTGAVPMQENENGIILISGFSKNLFEMVASGDIDPWKALKRTLDSERYDVVRQVFAE